MHKDITINGVTYKIHDMDFGNFLCDMEERNIDALDMMSGKTAHVFSFCRAFIDIVTGLDSLEASGKLLTKHIANGGKMDELLEVFLEMAIDAGFGDTEAEETAAGETAAEEADPQDGTAKATITSE